MRYLELNPDTHGIEAQTFRFINSQLKNADFFLGLKRSEKEREIPVYTVSIVEADGYGLTEHAALKSKLENLKLFDEKYLYTGFAPSLLSRLLRDGTVRSRIGKGQYDAPDGPNALFCCEIYNPPLVAESGIYNNPEDDIFEYFYGFDDRHPKRTEQNTYGMIAIYDRKHFKPPGTGPKTSGDGWTYEFKHPDRKLDALVAVVRVLGK